MKSPSTYFHSQKLANRGIALVITLLVIVVLTVAVTAFMQSMSLERRTSQAYLNIEKAEQAANAGLEAALQQLVSYDTGAGVRAPMPDFHYVVSKTSPSIVNRTATTIARLTPDSPVVLTTTELASRQSGAARTYQFKSANTPDIREVDLVAIKNAANIPIGNYGYFIDSGTSKQSVVEPVRITRASLLALSELPFVKQNSASLTAAETAGLLNFTNTNPSWKTLLLSPSSINQFTTISPIMDDWNVELENWSPSLNQLGRPRLDLRQLKYYLDNNLSSSQASGNIRSQVVEALLNQSNQALQSNWGGGDLRWLVDPLNPKSYTLIEARQIVANLMDYIDADIFPTSDSDTAPTYLGVEGQYATINGVQTTMVRGHPYINAVSTGLIFNRSGGASRLGGLNSTRVLCTLGIVNPWETETLPWGGSYTVEIETTVTGNVTGGTLGSAPTPYFSSTPFQTLSDQINAYPPQTNSGKIQSHAGYAFPQPNSGSAGYSTPFYTISPPQPPNMGFDNMNVIIKKLRLKYTSGISSAYVQILDNLSVTPMPMVPVSITLPPSSGPSIFKFSNGAPDKTDLHLKGDPRLNYQSSDWYLTKNTESGTLPPQPVTAPNVFSGMSSTDGDGVQSVPTGANWYTSPNMSKHLFVRSPELYGNDSSGSRINPANFPYDPAYASPQLAITSTAELGYLFTGRPWQTLRMYQTAATPTTREDWTLLDSISTGTLPLRDQTSALPGLKSVNGPINPVTGRDSAIRALFTNVPALSSGTNVDSLVDAVKTIPVANLPFVSSGDLFKDSRVVWPAVTTDFAKEELARRISNFLTIGSQVFTVHTYGESLTNGRVTARARMRVTVELVPQNGVLTTKILQRISDPL